MLLFLNDFILITHTPILVIAPIKTVASSIN